MSYRDRRIGAQFRTHRADTAADIAARIRAREIGAQANRETHARFPVLTAENIGEALDFQAARILELTQGDSK